MTGNCLLTTRVHNCMLRIISFLVTILICIKPIKRQTLPELFSIFPARIALKIFGEHRMSNGYSRPIIFLAFANQHGDQTRYLRQLNEEYRRLEENG